MTALAVDAALAMLGVAMLLNLWRLARGPDATDRALALDTLYVNSAAMLILYGVQLGTARYYEAALLIAMLGFLGTLALAKFLLRGDIIE
ncbi:MAG: K+/H+ antiporter subunit F [Ectothiorhodospiraceae bacterium]|nr:K+/H+ antiporter subunit F [Ectothiorhodospiraceae bacterium]